MIARVYKGVSLQLGDMTFRTGDRIVDAYGLFTC
jgi:hypothetical protein